MTIDELIKSLQEAKQTYGNINVRTGDAEDRGHDIEGYTIIDERKPKEEYKDNLCAEYLLYGDEYTEKTGRKEMIIWTFP